MCSVEVAGYTYESWLRVRLSDSMKPLIRGSSKQGSAAMA